MLAAGTVFWARAIAVGTVAEAACVALMTLGLVGFVASEDTYRDDDTSRWVAYNSHEIVVWAVLVAGVTVALLLAAQHMRRRDLAVGGFLRRLSPRC